MSNNTNKDELANKAKNIVGDLLDSKNTNISSNKIKLYIAGLLIWIALFAIGEFVTFLPSTGIMLGSMAVAFLLTSFMYWKLRSVNVSNSIKLIAIFFIFIFMYETIAKPIPFILNSFIGEPGYENTRVTGKDSSTSKSSTRYYINTEIPNWFLIGTGLTVTEDQYRMINVRDNVLLEGKKSVLGLYVSKITTP